MAAARPKRADSGRLDQGVLEMSSKPPRPALPALPLPGHTHPRASALRFGPDAARSRGGAVFVETTLLAAERGWGETATRADVLSVRVSETQGSLAGPIAGGVFGGAIGLAVGGVTGVGIECAIDCSGEFGGLLGFALGTSIGEILGVAAGVHLGNGRRGMFLDVAGASLGVAVAGLLVADAADAPGLLIVVIPTQIGVSVAVERATAGVP